jgi:hypothetical protein
MTTPKDLAVKAQHKAAQPVSDRLAFHTQSRKATPTPEGVARRLAELQRCADKARRAAEANTHPAYNGTDSRLYNKSQRDAAAASAARDRVRWAEQMMALLQQDDGKYWSYPHPLPVNARSARRHWVASERRYR